MTRPTRNTARCVECGAHDHPGRVIARSYCEHRTCLRGPCFTDHPRTCPIWQAVTGGRAAPEAASGGTRPVQSALFEVQP